MVNKVILVGNLGRDPEVRSTPSGQSVAEFRLATTRRWRDRDGNRQEQTEWHSIVAWGKLAEICGQYLHKGKQVYIEGRLQTRSWEDKNHGDKRYKTEVVADEMKMLGSRGDSYSPGPSAPAELGYGGGGAQSGGAQSGGSQSGGGQGGGGQSTGAQVADGPDDDDIPF